MPSPLRYRALLLLITLLLFIFVSVVTSDSRAVRCRNQKGVAVDWWFIYKENDGHRYIYYDSVMAQADLVAKRAAIVEPVNLISRN